jgi:branched-chain amino acid aminotransferase
MTKSRERDPDASGPTPAPETQKSIRTPRRLAGAPPTQADWIWWNGTIVPWAQAQVHSLVHGLHYGTGVFEGLRCYRTDHGTPAIFRLREHVQRFFQSAAFLSLEIPYVSAELEQACVNVVQKNRFTDCYVRPFAFFGLGEMGFALDRNEIHVGIAAWKWGSYLGEEGMRNGIRLGTVSWRKTPSDSVPSSAKLTGNYTNAVLAFREAKRAGFDEALLLTHSGRVAEGSGENVFVVREGRIRTPPAADDNLPGITRDSVMRLARDLGHSVDEETLARSDLYSADEVFLTGTAAEVTPVREIDRQPVGSGRRGPVTQQLQEAYADVVRGRSGRFPEWRTPVPD